MTCRSGSVQSVADKTVAAKEQIDKLEQMIKSQSDDFKGQFYTEIDAHLASAHIADARELAFNSDVKTEYTSEFSLDKIAAVVTSALKAVAAAQDPAAKTPALGPDAIAAYTDVVNTVAEAAKSSSTSSASLSFSMTRLSPGLFAFLSASSVNIKDEDTFGTEAVTTTAIFYRFMQSINDIQNETMFGEAVIDARNLLNMKTLQAALTDQLAAGTIDIDTWTKKDDAFTAAVNKIQARLQADGSSTPKRLLLTKEHGFGVPINHSFESGSDATKAVVLDALKRLEGKRPEFQQVIDLSNQRLQAAYY